MILGMISLYLKSKPSFPGFGRTFPRSLMKFTQTPWSCWSGRGQWPKPGHCRSRSSQALEWAWPSAKPKRITMGSLPWKCKCCWNAAECCCMLLNVYGNLLHSHGKWDIHGEFSHQRWWVYHSYVSLPEGNHDIAVDHAVFLFVHKKWKSLLVMVRFHLCIANNSRIKLPLQASGCNTAGLDPMTTTWLCPHPSMFIGYIRHQFLQPFKPFLWFHELVESNLGRLTKYLHTYLNFIDLYLSTIQRLDSQKTVIFTSSANCANPPSERSPVSHVASVPTLIKPKKISMMPMRITFSCHLMVFFIFFYGSLDIKLPVLGLWFTTHGHWNIGRMRLLKNQFRWNPLVPYVQTHMRPGQCKTMCERKQCVLTLASLWSSECAAVLTARHYTDRSLLVAWRKSAWDQQVNSDMTVQSKHCASAVHIPKMNRLVFSWDVHLHVWRLCGNYWPGPVSVWSLDPLL